MYIRCAECHASTWIESLVPGVAAATATCRSCDQQHSLMNAGEIGVDEDEQYQRALQFAEFNGIDLPSSYSVLLGVMELEAAKEFRRQNAASVAAPSNEDAEATGKDEAPPSFSADMGGGRTGYDPEFKRAVDEGHLTAEQAVARGDRSALVHRLTRKHALSRELAAAVADNQINLSEARRKRPSIEGTINVTPEDAAFSSMRRQLLVGFAAVTMLALAFQGYLSWRQSVETSLFEDGRGARRAAALAETEEQTRQQIDLTRIVADRTRVETDIEGQVMRVEGPDPMSVLKSFCTTGPNAWRFEPIELTEAIPPSSGRRIGIYRDLRDLGTLFGIRIDRHDNIWASGDGQQPVPTLTAPRTPIGSRSVAVR